MLSGVWMRAPQRNRRNPVLRSHLLARLGDIPNATMQFVKVALAEAFSTTPHAKNCDPIDG